MAELHADAGKAVAEKGQVLLDGPDGIAIALTPDAAEITGHELFAQQRKLRHKRRSNFDPFSVTQILNMRSRKRTVGSQFTHETSGTFA